MAKPNFKFNPETLGFEKVEKKLSKTLVKVVLPKFLLSVGLGVTLFIGSTFVGQSPGEAILKEKNNDLKLKYDLLNRGFGKSEAILEKLQKNDDNVYRNIFEAEPIPNSVRKAGFGGSDKYKNLKNLPESKLIIDATQRLDILSKQMVVQSKSYEEIVELVKNKEKMLACIPAIKPISNKELTRFGSAFGYRMHPILHCIKLHTGIDLTAPRGSKVYAPGDGVVIRADAASSGYGNHIRISHGYNYVTLYGHLSKILVKPGQKVKRGDVIGLVGSTGRSTAPHLHYEVRFAGKPINPVNFYYDDLTDKEYEEMIKISNSSDTHTFE